MRGAGTASDENETGESKPSRITLTSIKMKTKHTAEKLVVKFGTVVKCNEATICETRRINVSEEERKANAVLIAAAPQMLEAIQGCLDTYANKEQTGTPLVAYEKFLMLALKEAYKNATGQEYEPQQNQQL